MLSNDCEIAKEFGLRIAIITALQRGRPGEGELLRRFPDVLGPHLSHVSVISGWTLIEKDHLSRIREKTRGKKGPMIYAALLYVPKYEMGALATLARGIRNVDVVIYFLSPPVLLPTLLAKLFRKKTIFIVAGLGSKEIRSKLSNKVGRRLFPRAYAMLEHACFHLVDVVAAESAHILHSQGLQKFSKKFMVFGAKPVDTTVFRIVTPWVQRENLIGFVGRLSPEKGVLNFVEAIPRVLADFPNLRLLIVGDGVLRKRIEGRVHDLGLKGKVTCTGWVPHEEIQTYLNRLKLMVLPSESEGLPPIVEEAMACGTPVLATAVGGIPDLIKNGETGFLLEDNSPECIARRVIEVLNDPRLPDISVSASTFIRENYSREVIAEQWRTALESLYSR